MKPGVYVHIPFCEQRCYYCAFTVAVSPEHTHQPYVRRLIEAFGPRRCFWGTDLSAMLSRTTCTYRQAVTMFTEEMKFLSADDLEWIMGRGLAECLAWPAK